MSPARPDWAKSAGPSPVRTALRLTRPAQWPILTAQLVLGMVLAVPSANAGRSSWLANHELLPLVWWRLAATWFTWVVLLNGGTLAFNSSYDCDTGPIAYLRAPPPPPRHLAQIAVGAMVCGALLGAAAVTLWYGLLLAGCTALSVLYSHPATRWKSRPGLDLLVNILGYGAGTTLAGLVAVASIPTASGWWFTIGFGLLFGSLYPLTQIYQTATDRERGDRTLTTALGIRPSLVLALVLGLAAAAALLRGCEGTAWPAALTAGLALWCGHLVWWWFRSGIWSDAAHERGMYRALVIWAIIDVLLGTIWWRG